MRDSKIAQALADIANLGRVKLGPEWALPVMLMCASEIGFKPTRRMMFDGELAEITFSKLNLEIAVPDDVNKPEDV